MSFFVLIILIIVFAFVPRWQLYWFMSRGWKDWTPLVDFKPMFKLMAGWGLLTGLLADLAILLNPKQFNFSPKSFSEFVLPLLFCPLAVLFVNLFETYTIWFGRNLSNKIFQWFLNIVLLANKFFSQGSKKR